MNLRWTSIWASILIALLPIPAARAVSVADFSVFSPRDAGGNVILPGRLYIPPLAISQPGSPRPIITYLHGGGSSGVDNIGQLTNMSDSLLAQAKLRGAFLYAPQAPGGWSSSTTIDRAMMALERAIAEKNIDRARLYVTGHSEGGGGTWNLLSRYPGRFAAAIPISGIAPAPGFMPANLIPTPIWTFHSRDDAVVSVTVSRSVIGGILIADQQLPPNYSLGSAQDLLVSNPLLTSHQLISQHSHLVRNVKDFFVTDPQLDLLYYESSVGGHNVNNIYSSPEIYDWMFAHSTAVPEPEAVVAAASAVGLVVLGARRRWAEHFLSGDGDIESPVLVAPAKGRGPEVLEGETLSRGSPPRRTTPGSMTESQLGFGGSVRSSAAVDSHWRDE